MPKTAILATALGFAIVQLDVSIVNVALAAIASDLHSGVTDLQWVVDAYTVAFAALLLSAGAFGDRRGSRRAYVLGFAIFGCASFCCGLAPNVPILVAARLVQGAGAALLVPCSLALLNHATAQRSTERAKAVGWWTSAGSMGLAAGPIIGGLLIASIGWRTIFFVNVPIAVAGIVLALRGLEETPAHREAADLPGQVLAIATLTSVTAAVIMAGKLGWPNSLVLGGFVLAAICGALFVRTELRSRTPMLPLDFFTQRPFRAAVAVGFAINLTVYGALFILSLYMQKTLGYSPLQTGLAFLPPCIAIGIANVLAGGIVARFGPWLPMIAGLLISALGFFLLGRLDTHSTYADLLPGLLLFSFGIGMAVPPMTTAILEGAERKRSGVASGVLNTVRQSAGALGIALFGTLLATASVSGFRTSFIVSTILVLLACVSAASVPGLRLAFFQAKHRHEGFLR